MTVRARVLRWLRALARRRCERYVDVHNPTTARLIREAEFTEEENRRSTVVRRVVILALGLGALIAACVRVGVEVTVDSTDPQSLIAQYAFRLQELCASGAVTEDECEALTEHLDEVAASLDSAAARALGAHTDTVANRGARRILGTIARRLLNSLR